jgi:hypothetical protein
MKKIVSNILVVSVQLIVAGLFLCMLFSDSNEDNKVVVIENDNLNKMADSVSALFTEEKILVEVIEDTTEVELQSVEDEEARKAEEEEAKRKAEEEAAEVARIAAEEEAKKNAIIVSASGYASKPGYGFNVTTDNKTYDLTDDEIYTLSSVVACEANRASKDDILAVASVILNRAEVRGVSPVTEVSSGGFSCWGTSTVPTNIVLTTVKDALSGIRNNTYTGFRSWTSGYSENYIVEGGNRYGSW